jgi:hypothetical protein
LIVLDHNAKAWIVWSDGLSSGKTEILGLYAQYYDFSWLEDGNDDVTAAVPAMRLQGNYPNPFNPVTTIAFSLPKAGKAKLEVFNVKGQKVKTLADENMTAGHHTVTWTGVNDENKAVSSGVYFYRLTSSESTLTHKMILMK